MNIPSELQRAQAAQETFATPSPVEKAASVQPASREPGGDEAHLSTVANVITQSASQTDVRADKVAAVQSAIASGSYHVESSKVAGKLIEHLLGNGS